MNHYRNLSRSVVLIWPSVKNSPIMLGLSCLVSVQPQGLLWLCQTNSRRGRLGFLWRRLVAVNLDSYHCTLVKQLGGKYE